MKATKLIGAGIAALALAGCNSAEVEEKLKTVYREAPATAARDSGTFKVTDKFGALKVREGEITGESKNTPWSAWWYPLNEKTLFYNNSGSASPLEKYDFFAQKTTGNLVESAVFEQRNIFQPNEVAWAGLCHAWAIASVLHPEPKETKHLGGVKWSVGDQKALLLKTYEAAQGISDIMFGERYNGDRNDDYDDIYPDQFHRLLQHHLVENQKPALMDYDARSPVWTVPIYKVKFIIEKSDAETARVSAWVTFASPHVDDLDFVGTKRVVKNYTYILKGEWRGSEFLAKGGEWTEDSKTDHPDYLMSFPDSLKRGSRNTELNVEIVDSILR